MLLDYGFDFGFWHLRDQACGLIQADAVLVPFQNHFLKDFLHWYSSTVSQPTVLP